MSDKTDERSLADLAELSKDVSPEITPETFDFEAFIAGFRPVRRSVTLYRRADLIGELERLADRIEASPDDADVDALIDQFDQVRDEFNRGTTVVVEGRSQEWVDQFKKERLDALGVEKLEADDERVVTIVLEQLAEQIVEPKGWTVDHLRTLADAAPSELNKVIAAMTFANTQLPQSAQVLTRDFSQRRSAARRG